MMSPSPWAKIQQPESSTSFVDITSEQLAKNLQEKFNRYFIIISIWINLLLNL